ncbi:MAG: hypothetical protein ABI885_24055, partial [Gammaproteobacteria bacterium]
EADKSYGPNPTIDRNRMIVGSGTVYEALDVLGDALKATRGRKNLVLFSPGILEPGQEIMNGVAVGRSRFYKPMINSLNAANVSVYGVSLLGETDAPPMVHQTMEMLAYDTNGEYFRYAVGFDPLLKKVEKATNGYYLLSYYSNHPKGVKGYQKVKVALNSRDLRIKARNGYAYGE